MNGRIQLILVSIPHAVHDHWQKKCVQLLFWKADEKMTVLDWRFSNNHFWVEKSTFSRSVSVISL
jgi:hypothetical protein